MFLVIFVLNYYTTPFSNVNAYEETRIFLVILPNKEAENREQSKGRLHQGSICNVNQGGSVTGFCQNASPGGKLSPIGSSEPIGD